MADTHNQLIQRLSASERRHLLGRCEPVPLRLAQVLAEPTLAPTHAWFPVQGHVSLLTPVDGHPGLELALVGREGLLGVGDAPLRALVQGPGMAWRIGADDLRAELCRSPGLQALLLHYLHARVAQLARAAACLHFHRIAPRLARRLLSTQDLTQADHFGLTHVALAGLLGVRRVGITTAAGELQRQGLIHYHRGEVQVLDRAGLERAACSCYAAGGRWQGADAGP